MSKLTEVSKTVWNVQLNTAAQILHSALSRAGESVPSEAREKLHLALEHLHDADRIVRFTPVKEPNGKP